MKLHASDNLTTHISMLAISHRSQQCKNQALAQEVEELNQKVETLTQENVILKKAITQSNSSVQWLQSIVGLFPKLFIIEDYKNHILDGNVWYSPPFYSHLHGYKLCFQVRQNRRHPQYMVISVCLMRGEFDDKLQCLLLNIMKLDHNSYFNFQEKYDSCRFIMYVHGLA